MKRPGSASDPLWYKDAIIYEFSVKGFYDSNNDGLGDFPGLLQKLDYLQDLGVTCLWLLPFFPSPLRDDGYDISDYRAVHPSYGALEDFQAFLQAAHQRGMQVMIELVVNHTSDQHPWFQRARHAPPGSPERDFYVWSDTDRKFSSARIIFTDTEKSNWTWDPVANAYYWHRFFSHQPDLNYDNPEVLQEVVDVMRYWLDMGVDGLRLDAIPYLVEREGTNCENLPETHAIVKRIRRQLDEQYQNRLILAEANQWPTDVRPYFGDGDECHMAFHFPLMPRLFMALRLEDRHPITEIMAQTPDIPDTCQWGLFLRNHDELTLEMVSDEERDYMYFAYSADPRMRVNIGIRRRLAPLMDNNRRRIELLNGILFSFPGTPILYYGDEIGMGDNIYLGDRDGVRTPMQWSGDRNAGFSRATPARLYSPVIMDPVYGYEAINVEAQQSDPSSLLSWMRNMIALRKLFKVFGRGSMEFLHPSNRKVLAYVRSFGGETILCVANLSRFAQPVELDLSRFSGMAPIEMLGYVEFPLIRKTPYSLTLGPYGYLWFELQPAAPPPPAPAEAVVQDVVLQLAGWETAFTGAAREALERDLLPKFLPRQRWFGAKARTIEKVSVQDWSADPDSGAVFVLLDVRYAEGGQSTYFVPLAFLPAAEAALLQENSPEAVLAPCRFRGEAGMLCDAAVDERFSRALLNVIGEGKRRETCQGVVLGKAGRAFAEIRGSAAEPLPPVRGSAEQSNTSIRYGRRLILKLYRKTEPGPNPDCELTSYLSESAGLACVPRFGGSLEYLPREGAPTTLAMLQELVSNQGDGWEWTLDELGRFYERALPQPFAPALEAVVASSLFALSEAELPPAATDPLGIYLEMTAALARRTAEMHLALAAAEGEESWRAQPMTGEELARLAEDLAAHAARVFEQLKYGLSKMPDDLVETAGFALSRRRQLLDRFRGFDGLAGPILKTRIHGDYHLGQVLRVENEYCILDFEGEPARPLAERRAKQSPLKDVAGMLRSFSYAAWAAFLNHTSRLPQDAAALEPWVRLWEKANCGMFLRTYRNVVAGAGLFPRDAASFTRLLDAFMLDKALYELNYELNNRPNWTRIPLLGILALS
jgi:maltose alpha-D-glucosyltransferase/alpha-amylase